MNNKSSNEIIWFLFGVLIGFAFLALIITVIAIDLPPGEVLEGIKTYQSIITGVFAVFAAVFTALIIKGQTTAVYDQIQQTERLENERLERSEYAARAVLPHALRMVEDYLHQCVERVLLGLHDAYENEDRVVVRETPKDGPPEIPQLPQLSKNAITNLRENIEVALDPIIREKLRDLIAKLQIQNSNLQGKYQVFNNHLITSGEDLENHYGDVIALLTLINHIFAYARFDPKYKSGPLTIEDYIIAARNCERGEIGFPQNKLMEIAQRRFEADKQGDINTSQLFV